MAQKPTPLADLDTSIYGSGIYALYYSGKSPLYAPISGSASPIYVGKSSPPDGAITVIEQDNVLMARLRDHKLSINSAVGNLDIAEFSFRFLVVASGWESPAELELIRYFKPVWNKGNGIEPVHGFGNHNPGAGRAPGSQSEWDTLHTGRSSASLKANEKTSAQLKTQVAKHFKQVPPVASRNAVIEHFLESIAEPPTNI
ncbi:MULTISPECIES: Eco29kI family restriction endonuclease [unclassified Mycobacterium]|uniref:Eco29kI family restriction endonuclease n=1 Tax=unclassified Mycobacterium TaxID=2642494 RepID=UPI002570E435|nr:MULTISPECIES: Eco29kI family restriction endonuclease [unclassified Mycobacterium]